MRKLYLIGGIIIGLIISVGSIASAAFAPISVPAGGTGTTTALFSQLLYGSGTLTNQSYQSVATTTVSCSGTASCTPFVTIGGSPITIVGSASGGSGNTTWEISALAGWTGFLAPTTTQRVAILQASSTMFSAFTAYFGGSATSSFSTAGALTLATPLLVASGGSGAGTLTGLLSGNGTSAFTATANGTNGFVLAMSGGIPTWVATSSINNGVTSVATNNGLTGGTITTTGTIGLATINAGVLGAVKNGDVPTSQATSTLYGVGTGGFVLGYSGGQLIPLATTTFTGSGPISLTYASGQVTGSCATCNTSNATVSSITAGLGLNGGTITTSGAVSLISYLATSTGETAGQLAYWNTTNGTPAKLHSIATTTLTLPSYMSYTGTLGSLVGGVSGTLSIATSSLFNWSAGFNAGTNQVKQIEHPSFTYATSTWVGTTTIPLQVAYGQVFNNVRCFSDTGTLNVDFYHASSHLNLLNASTTIGTFNFSTNNTMTDGDIVKADIGTPASSPTKITCTVQDTL